MWSSGLESQGGVSTHVHHAASACVISLQSWASLQKALLGSRFCFRLCPTLPQVHQFWPACAQPKHNHVAHLNPKVQGSRKISVHHPYKGLTKILPQNFLLYCPMKEITVEWRLTSKLCKGRKNNIATWKYQNSGSLSTFHLGARVLTISC